ncbi:Ribonuclease H [Abeliophyllum distichum]|uniref:Ribonuclease H n=1 Tax=Abeliophyllum distichum TaxID=126358 RepID=A0ABD1SYH0_9LAMI
MNWVIELGQFDISFKPRAAIKGQALADFLAMFAKRAIIDLTPLLLKLPSWKLYVDVGDSARRSENGSCPAEVQEGSRRGGRRSFPGLAGSQQAPSNRRLGGLGLGTLSSVFRSATATARQQTAATQTAATQTLDSLQSSQTVGALEFGFGLFETKPKVLTFISFLLIVSL